MNMFNDMGFNIEIIIGKDFSPKQRAKNDPLRAKIIDLGVDDKGDITEEERKEVIESLKKTEAMRSDNFSCGVNIHENLQYVDISSLEHAPQNLYPCPLSQKDELIKLIASIQSVGLIEPIIIAGFKDYDKYHIICGRARILAYKDLFKATKSEKYLKIPAFVLDEDRINVARELCEEFGMSKSSIYNYITLGNLAIEIQALIWDNKLSNQAGLLLSNVNHETQLKIVETIGVKKLNDIRLLKFLCDKRKKNLTEKEILHIQEKLDNYPLKKIHFSINVSREIAGDFMDTISEFKASKTKKLDNGAKKFNMHKFFSVNYNKDVMETFLKSKTINTVLLDRVLVKNLEELKEIK